MTVSITQQTLTLWDDEQCTKMLKKWRISSAKNGVGEKEGSECTPRGLHRIAEKIGAKVDINTVFVGRVPTGEYHSLELHEQHPNRDWILTRILRLEGLEEGLNKGVDSTGHCCDSWNRYIYIHGTPDQTDMSLPGSKGCLRMHNHDLIELFDQIHIGIQIQINQ